MHDKYYYEAAQMSLIDTDLKRTFATGIAGFSHVVDSLSAIKYAKVKTIRDEDGIVVDYEVEGDFPRYGNDDDRADEIARNLLSTFMDKLKLAAIVTHVADARTCVLHPASHTHRQMTEEQLKEAGVAPDLIRFSVGIEDAADIIADLEQALAQI